MITLNVKSKDTFFEKLIGLCFQKNIAHGIYFRTSIGIHSFFMLAPIDVLLVDENNIVTDLWTNFSPLHVWIWGWRQRTVIELPVGTIKSLNLTVGTQVVCNETFRAAA